MIGVGGGYDQSVIDDLKRDLAALPSTAPAKAAKPSAIPLEGFDVTMVEKDAPATAISMGFPIDVLRGSKDWYALADREFLAG